MRFKNLQILIILSMIISSCSITDISQRKIKISTQAGLNKGGITENTDLKLIDQAENQSDVFTGATKTSFNVGLHLNKPLKYGEFETGLDFMQNKQTFKYDNFKLDHLGQRQLTVNQLMIPITYNLIVFKKNLHKNEIQLKIGYLGQFNFVNTHENGKLPDYDIKKWSNGAVFGVSAYPIILKNNSKIGLFADLYRGSQIYIDEYNKTEFEMPGSSFIKYGIRYKF